MLYYTSVQTVVRCVRSQAVPRQHSGTRRRRLLRYIAPCCVFLALVAQIWVRLLIVERGYVLEEFRATALERDVELRSLRIAYDRISSPARLVSLSESRLGMRERAPQQVQMISTP